MASGCACEGSLLYLPLFPESSIWQSPQHDRESMGKGLKITNISHGTQICTRIKDLGGGGFTN